MGDKAVTSENACRPNNFRAYSPQISGDSRLRPDTPSEQFEFIESRHDVEPGAVDPSHRG